MFLFIVVNLLIIGFILYFLKCDLGLRMLKLLGCLLNGVFWGYLRYNK